MITERGIEANLVKIEAIRRMRPPSTKKNVQKLTGRLASLNRFISRSVEKSLPFFKVLKGTENFHLGPEQDKAFEDLKKVLGKLGGNDKPNARSRALVVHRNFKLHDEHGISRRENNRRHPEVVTNLLRIRSSKQIKVPLL